MYASGSYDDDITQCEGSHANDRVFNQTSDSQELAKLALPSTRAWSGGPASTCEAQQWRYTWQDTTGGGTHGMTQQWWYTWHDARHNSGGTHGKTQQWWYTWQDTTVEVHMAPCRLA